MAELRGLANMLKSLRADHASKGAGAARGLKKAALFLLKEANKIIPVDLGNLKASGEVRAEGNGFNTVARVVYTAGYAIYVHENLDAAHGEEYNQKYAKEIDHNEFQATLKKSKRVFIYDVNGTKFHRRGYGQQAKFLERPFREEREYLKKLIRDEIDKS